MLYDAPPNNREGGWEWEEGMWREKLQRERELGRGRTRQTDKEGPSRGKKGREL